MATRRRGAQGEEGEKEPQLNDKKNLTLIWTLTRLAAIRVGKVRGARFARHLLPTGRECGRF